MTTGSLGDWAKKPGDGIAPGDVLLEIETDKATMDFEAQEDGFVAKILVPSGTKDVPVNSPIAVLVEEASDVDKFVNFTPEAASATPAPAVEQVAPASGSTAPTAASAPIEPMVTSIASPSRTIASPLAKSMAKDKGLDLRGLVPGSGPNGRIVKADILAHKKGKCILIASTSLQ